MMNNRNPPGSGRILKYLAVLSVAAVCLAAATAARAQQVASIDMTFASGATFTGTVDFAADWSYVTGVNGILSGGGYGTTAITWVWNPGTNYLNNMQQGGLPVSDEFGTTLMSGTPGVDGPPNYSDASFTYFIGFAYNYSGANETPPEITFAGIGNWSACGTAPTSPVNCANNIDNPAEDEDPMTGGGIQVPEPGTATLLGIGLLILGWVSRGYRKTIPGLG